MLAVIGSRATVSVVICIRPVWLAAVLDLGDVDGLVWATRVVVGLAWARRVLRGLEASHAVAVALALRLPVLGKRLVVRSIADRNWP
eukprot:5832530-Pyramimonas_sp.AAC.1